MGGFGMMGDLFLPGARHAEEERNRLAVTRDEEGEGDPHRGPIDLSSGKVVIRARKKDVEDVPEPEEDTPPPPDDPAPQGDPPSPDNPA